MKRTIIRNIVLVSLLSAITGCSWDNSLYDKYVIDDHVVFCSGYCDYQESSLSEDRCAEIGGNWTSAYCKSSNGTISYTKTKNECEKIKGNWIDLPKAVCITDSVNWTKELCNKLSDNNENVKSTWYDFSSLDLGNGRYIVKLQNQNNEYVCGSYGDVTSDNPVISYLEEADATNSETKCSIEEIRKFEDANEFHLCEATTKYCAPMHIYKDAAITKNAQNIAMCSTCEVGLTSCIVDKALSKSRCFDLSSDINHCGSCNKSCATMERCINGECVSTSECPEGCPANSSCNENVCTCYSNLVSVTNNDSKLIKCVDPSKNESCGATAENPDGSPCDEKSACVQRGETFVCKSLECEGGFYCTLGDETEPSCHKSSDHCGLTYDNGKCSDVSCDDGFTCNDTHTKCVCKDGKVPCGPNGACVDPSSIEYCGLTESCIANQNQENGALTGKCVDYSHYLSSTAVECKKQLSGQYACKCAEGYQYVKIQLTNGVEEFRCVNPKSDSSYCEQGDNDEKTPGPCDEGKLCKDGVCDYIGCMTGMTMCNQRCIDLETYHMTDCNHCATGWATLSNDYEKGCTINLSSDPHHCGSIEVNCNSIENSTAICNEGRCNVLCKNKFNYCNGACLDYKSDFNNCGKCGNKCSENDSKCNNGVCCRENDTIGNYLLERIEYCCDGQRMKRFYYGNTFYMCAATLEVDTLEKENWIIY